MTRRSRLGPLCLGAATAGILAFAIPAVALAHPLGNFTVNVYAGLRVSPSEIRIDAVVDQAEIPTFQERLLIDTDGDGEVSDAEAQAARQPECAAIAPGLSLVVGDAAVPLRLTATGLSFPPGAGGLSTMRIVCEFVAPLRTPIAASTTVRFTNRVHVDRLGWREITLEPDGTTIAQSGVSTYYYGTPFNVGYPWPINRTGRFIRIQLTATQFLNLSEVQVWSPPAQLKSLNAKQSQ